MVCIKGYRIIRQRSIAVYSKGKCRDTEEEVNAALAASDSFVLTSYIDGIPVSAMEAMAVGVPVIATNIAGTSELVEHGVTGLLVRPSDNEALKKAINHDRRSFPETTNCRGGETESRRRVRRRRRSRKAQYMPAAGLGPRSLARGELREIGSGIRIASAVQGR